MNIIYISTSCSNQKYKEIYELRSIKAIEPQQKFNALLINGLSMCEGANVIAVSTYPVSSSTCSLDYFDYKEDVLSNSLVYHYIPFHNSKICRLFDIYKNTKRFVSVLIKEHKNEECVFIVDALSVFMVLGCFSIAKRYCIPIIGIVTDLPHLATNMKSRKYSFMKRLGLNAIQKLNNLTLKRYDGYITLTESLNEVVNHKNAKPHLLLEGSVDSNIIITKKARSVQRIVVYAGGVYAKYGVKNLVEAFSLLRTDAELHIYGDGTYADDIKEISKIHHNIKYKGVVPLEDIVEIEQKSTLLVNPRPSDEEFAKYSFPSKTLEYMSSGTPLLSTRLPGIPKEYFEHIYTIDDESVDGIKNKLMEILATPEEEINKKGADALSFVMKEKTNVIQGMRILRFAQTLIKNYSNTIKR